MAVELPGKPRGLNDSPPLPGAGLAVKPVASWVTASMTLCWPRSLIVSALMISMLAGVCKGVRLRRLPLPAVWFSVSVGAAGDAGAVVDGVAAAAAAAGFFPPRVARGALVLLDWRGLTVGVGLVTTTGSSFWLDWGPACDQASNGQRTEESATEYSKDVRDDAR